MEHAKYSIKSYMKEISRIATKTIKIAFNISDEALLIPVSNKPDFDCQIPTCVKIFNKYKKSHNSFGYKTPKALAEAFRDRLPENDIINSLEITDQGFIFIRIQDNFIEREINSIISNNISLQAEDLQTVVVEFSSPSVAKPFNLDIVNNTLKGESLCRLLELQGHKVIRVSHLGDWGMTLGRLINYMKEKCPDYPSIVMSSADYQQFYLDAKKRMVEKLQTQRLAELTLIDLQQGDPDCRKVWANIYKVSKDEFDKMYQRFDVKVTDYPYSFYNDMLPELLIELEEKGLVEISRGSKCIFVKESRTPLVLQYCDGRYGYDLIYLAAAKYRLVELKADRIIISEKAGQKSHFNMVAEVVKKMDWHQSNYKLESIALGDFENYTGMGTRKVRPISITGVLDGIKLMAAGACRYITSKDNESSEAIRESDLDEEPIEKVCMAALKYVTVKSEHLRYMNPALHATLQRKGRTITYILRLYSKICFFLDINRIPQDDKSNTSPQESFKIIHQKERQVAMHLLTLSDVIENISKEGCIQKMCDFLYEICCKTPEGYKKYEMLKDSNMNNRILLYKAIKKVLDIVLYIIGISPPII